MQWRVYFLTQMSKPLKALPGMLTLHTVGIVLYILNISVVVEPAQGF